MNKKAVVFLRAILALGLAVAGGWLCDSTGMPLGWLVGAMLAIVVASFLRLPISQPAAAMPYAKAAVGTMLGAAIPLGFLQAFTQWWPSLFLMFGVMIVGGLLNYYGLRQLFGLSQPNAALCAMPGGIVEMIMLSERIGGDQARVAVTHALRITLSILAIPLLAKWVYGIHVDSATVGVQAVLGWSDYAWFVGCIMCGVLADKFIRLPLALILVPLVVAAGLHLSGLAYFSVPPFVSTLIQILIGINVGARFLGVAPAALMQVGLSALMVFSVQLSLALGVSYWLAAQGAFDALAVTLAYAPGGLAEMTLIAVSMGLDVTFVTFHHLLRVLFSLLIAPLLLSKLLRPR